MTLFFYVLRDFFRYVLASLTFVVFLFILFDFIHKTTSYIPRYQPDSWLIAKLYLYQLPTLLIQAMPIASLLASVVCMVVLSRGNEITAMRAVGMGPLRIGLPVAIGGLVLSLLAVGLGEWILPHAAKRMHFVEQVEIEGGSENQLFDGGQWIRQGSRLINFQSFDLVSGAVDGLQIIEMSDKFRPKSISTGERAVFDSDSNTWYVSDMHVSHFWPNATLSRSEWLDEVRLDLPFVPSEMQGDRRQPSELSLAELNELIRRGVRSGMDVLSYRVDFQVKGAFYFAAFVVSLIGLKFGYRSERSMETARSVLLAVGLGVSYWVILNAGRAMGNRGSLPPWFAAWLANFVIIVVSWISIIRARKA